MSLVGTERTVSAAWPNPLSVSLSELQEMRQEFAELCALDPAYLPVFERLDRMVSAREAADPIARARALLAAQKAMA